MKVRLVLAMLLVPMLSLAQESTQYRLSDYSLPGGGAAGLASGQYGMTWANLGERAVSRDVTSQAYRLDASFGVSYRPPGEVAGYCGTGDAGPCLLLGKARAAAELHWPSERSAGDYNLYRDRISHLSTLTFGACHEYRIAGLSATDTDTPPAGDAFFYLVTVNNRLQEEGAKGYSSLGTLRSNTDPCP